MLFAQIEFHALVSQVVYGCRPDPNCEDSSTEPWGYLVGKALVRRWYAQRLKHTVSKLSVFMQSSEICELSVIQGVKICNVVLYRNRTMPTPSIFGIMFSGEEPQATSLKFKSSVVMLNTPDFLVQVLSYLSYL